MDTKVTIYKLSVNQVLEIQGEAKRLDKLEEGEDSEEGLSVLKKIITMAVEGADDLDDDDFENFPMDELSNLSQEIMKFSGMDAKAAGKPS